MLESYFKYTRRTKMDIFDVLTLLGGLALFLYGMNTMSAGLEKMAGSKLEVILKRMTSNRFKAFLLGLVVTMIIQSSSATTVMLVGLVSSGIMQLGQTIGVIMGTNIGTTVTAWILSLVEIDASSNLILQIFKPDTLSTVISFIGILLIMFSKHEKRRDAGSICIGFAVLMIGMNLMSGAVEGLKDIEEFRQVLTAFNNPILGVLVGTVFTALLQSSSASVGILQALSLTGGITYSMAIPIIMGQNIGTCVTALISSIGANKNAKKVAYVHISFNIIGTVFYLVLFYVLHAIFDFAFVDTFVSPSSIAICHSIFNVATTILLFPFTKQLEWIANHIGGKKAGQASERVSFIDERLLSSPSFAVSECKAKTIEMVHLCKKAINQAIGVLDSYDENTVSEITEIESTVDKYEDKLGTFLVKLSNKDLLDKDNNEIAKILHTIGHLERISDYAVDIALAAKELHTKGISFSTEAKKELSVIKSALLEVVELTASSFENSDIALALKVEPLEQVIDLLAEQLKARHIERLQKGLCTIELGFIHSDLLSHFEHSSDQCSLIAACTIRLSSNQLDTHRYLKELKTSHQPQFEADYNCYLKKYTLPNE